MARKYDTQDLEGAARVEMWCEWRAGQDDDESGKSWEEIYARREWAIDIMGEWERSPEKFDGYEGCKNTCADSLYETAMDSIGV